jgi:cell wall-associated NlpC family hydrolase
MLYRVTSRSLVPGLIALVALGLSGCASSRAGLDAGDLDAAVARYEGVPYRYGGTSARTGFDCSGFLQVLFAEVYRHALPRTTEQQVREGREVPRRSLRRGDLVFFRIDRKGTRHAGVYLGEGRFAHASTSRGVMVSELSERYWKRRYWTARRVVEPGAQTPRLATEPSRTEPTQRVGW